MIVSGLPGSELDKGLPGFEEFNKYPRGALEQNEKGDLEPQCPEADSLGLKRPFQCRDSQKKTQNMECKTM